MNIDIQEQEDTRGIPIDSVGVRNVLLPVVLARLDGDDSLKRVPAKIDAAVSLEERKRGASLSRFLEVLHTYVDKDVCPQFVEDVLKDLKKILKAKSSYIKISFPYFYRKTAPKSGIKSYSYADVVLEGVLNESDKLDRYITVTTYYTSLCPCSKLQAMTDGKYFGAHNQRSKLTIRAQYEGFVYIETLVKVAEECSSCEVYELLKRDDEGYVTVKAFNNPKFVEDVVRDASIKLKEIKEIVEFEAEAEHEESIHQHNCYAIVRWKRPKND